MINCCWSKREKYSKRRYLELLWKVTLPTKCTGRGTPSPKCTLFEPAELYKGGICCSMKCESTAYVKSWVLWGGSLFDFPFLYF